MTTPIHNQVASDGESGVEIDLDSHIEPGDGTRSVLDTVLELFDEPSVQQSGIVHPELPTFAEQSYTDHQVDLAPANKDLLERERSLRAAGDWTALAQLLIERAELTRGERDAARLLMEAAEIYEQYMSNVAAAQAIAVKALEVDASNMDAVAAIERFAQRSGEWLELLVGLRRAAETLQSNEPILAGELWIRLACAYGLARNDVPRAFSTLAEVRAGEPSRVLVYLDALEPLIQHTHDLDVMLAVSHRIGDEARSARLLSRAIAMSQSVVERANYHHLIALIERNRNEGAAAEWHWQEALRLDPKRQDVREALGALYQKQGDFRKAVALLEEARVVSMDAQARVNYAVQAAQIYKEQFGENTRAIDLCAAALEVQPGHRQASMPVVQRYYEQGRWAELEPVLDSLLAGGPEQVGSQAEELELLMMAAECAFELAHHDKAHRYYSKCLSLSPRELEAALGCARASLAMGDAADAIAHANLATDLHEMLGHSATRIADTLFISADANRVLGKNARAIELYQFCVQNGHAGAMSSLAEIYSQQGDHRKAVDMRTRYAEGLPSAERVQVLCEIADTLADEIGDLAAGIAVCVQALTMEESCRGALHRLSLLYSKSGQWRAAIKTILKMADLETGAVRRARYLQAAAMIASQDGQRVEAVALFNKTIDSYFADSILSAQDEIRAICFENFRRVLELLTAAKDWRSVEQNYRMMICRLEPGDPEVGGLWMELGHVYRDKLGEDDAAMDSFEVACSLDADRMTNHRILVDLYEGAGADKLEKAIARRRLLLEKEPRNPEHYKALRSLFVRTRQMDRVFCVCRALEFMEAADDRERAFYRRNMSANLSWPVRPMNSEMRSRFRDSQVDPLVSRIFGLVAEIVAQEAAVSPAQAQLNETQDPQFDHLRQLFSATSFALGMPTFDCFVQPEQAHEIRLVNLRRGAALEPTFVLGRGLFAGRPINHIVHGLARHLFFGRRSYYLRLLLREPADLAAAFYAGVTLVRPDVAPPAGVGARMAAYRSALGKRLHPTWAHKLHEAVHTFLQQNSGPLDLYRWLDGVDATARHAGLLLCGDLGAASEALSAEPTMQGARKSQFLDRLLLDSVSEAHMSLREDLGLVIVEA